MFYYIHRNHIQIFVMYTSIIVNMFSQNILLQLYLHWGQRHLNNLLIIFNVNVVRMPIELGFPIFHLKKATSQISSWFAHSYCRHLQKDCLQTNYCIQFWIHHSMKKVLLSLLRFASIQTLSKLPEILNTRLATNSCSDLDLIMTSEGM